MPITVSYLSYVFYHNFLFIAAFEVLHYLKKALKVPNVEIMAQKRLQLHTYLDDKRVRYKLLMALKASRHITKFTCLVSLFFSSCL